MKRPDDLWRTTDALGTALHFMRMSGAFYCRSEFTERWGVEVPSIPGCFWFHIVTEGRAWLDAGEPEPRPLAPGQLTLVTHGRGHRLFSTPGVPTPSALEVERERLSKRYEILRHGEGGALTLMICGAVRLQHPGAHMVVATLPDVLAIDVSGSTDEDLMTSTLRLMAMEARELRPGGEAMLTRLGDILAMQAIRSWIDTAPVARTGWLGALKDPQIGRAIALIHRDPARGWTLSSLAREAAMSRSAFSARFTELVGEPVMRYVTRWRVHVALDSLEEPGATVAEVADQLGYRSEAAFSRAFKRVTGVSPGSVRRGEVTRETRLTAG